MSRKGQQTVDKDSHPVARSSDFEAPNPVRSPGRFATYDNPLRARSLQLKPNSVYLKRFGRQPGPEPGQSEDRHEQEADAIAAKVMRMPDRPPDINHPSSSPALSKVGSSRHVVQREPLVDGHEESKISPIAPKSGTAYHPVSEYTIVYLQSQPRADSKTLEELPNGTRLVILKENLDTDTEDPNNKKFEKWHYVRCKGKVGFIWSAAVIPDEQPSEAALTGGGGLEFENGFNLSDWTGNTVVNEDDSILGTVTQPYQDWKHFMNWDIQKQDPPLRPSVDQPLELSNTGPLIRFLQNFDVAKRDSYYFLIITGLSRQSVASNYLFAISQIATLCEDKEQLSEVLKPVIESALGGKTTCLNDQQIFVIRMLLQMLPMDSRGDYYKEIASRTSYRSQVDNEAFIAKIDATTESGLPDKNGGLWMCNVTSLAMIYDTLGASRSHIIEMATNETWNDLQTFHKNGVQDNETQDKSKEEDRLLKLEQLARLVVGILNSHPERDAVAEKVSELNVIRSSEQAKRNRISEIQTQIGEFQKQEGDHTAEITKLEQEQTEVVNELDVLESNNESTLKQKQKELEAVFRDFVASIFATSDENQSHRLEKSDLQKKFENMQYEDVIDALLYMSDSGSRYFLKSFTTLSNKVGVHSFGFVGYKGDRKDPKHIKEWSLKLLPLLQQGLNAMILIKDKAGTGHLVRLQWIEDDGMRVDDPVGALYKKIVGKETLAKFTWNRDEYGKKQRGLDNLWTWDLVASFFTDIQFFGNDLPIEQKRAINAYITHEFGAVKHATPIL